jgi:hypothetical protein
MRTRLPSSDSATTLISTDPPSKSVLHHAHSEAEKVHACTFRGDRALMKTNEWFVSERVVKDW